MTTPRRSPLLVALLGLVLAGAPAVVHAQQAAAATATLPSAREVVDRYLEVTKLKTALEKTKSRHIKGKFSMEAMGMTGAMEAWGARPDKRLTKIELGTFGTMTSGFDGTVGWQVNPMVGTRVLKDSELLQAKLEAAYDTDLKPASLYESMKTVGQEKFEGKDCFKVEVIAKPLPGMDPATSLKGRTTHEFYEVASGFLLGSMGVAEGEMGGGPFTQVFSDYKELGGAMIATRTVVRASGQEFALTVESVEFDTATDDLFALPKDVQVKVQPPAPKPQ